MTANKIMNVTMISGIIGMLGVSPKNKLNRSIKRANHAGWKVVQIIPADSGNILLLIFRIFLLLITFFLFTLGNGYYVVLEKEISEEELLKRKKTKQPQKRQINPVQPTSNTEESLIDGLFD